MNERIRELSKDADLDWHKHWNDDETNRLQQFAELIVEECRYVMDCNKGSDQNPAWNRALSETSEKIKQHFGVEVQGLTDE